MSNKIAALIAARGGSTRIKNKNIKKFSNTNLLENKINQLKKIFSEKDIFLNTDSLKIAEYGFKNKINVIIRDKKYASNSISMNEVYKNVVLEIPHDHIFFVHITSPLVKINTMRKILSIYKEKILRDNKFDSLVTVSKFKKFLWFKNKPINYNFSKMPRSQDLPDYFYINFAVNVLSKNLIIKNKNIIGKNFYPFFLSEIESFDIDEAEEFKIAEMIFNSKIKY